MGFITTEGSGKGRGGKGSSTPCASYEPVEDFAGVGFTFTGGFFNNSAPGHNHLHILVVDRRAAGLDVRRVRKEAARRGVARLRRREVFLHQIHEDVVVEASRGRRPRGGRRRRLGVAAEDEARRAAHHGDGHDEAGAHDDPEPGEAPAVLAAALAVVVAAGRRRRGGGRWRRLVGRGRRRRHGRRRRVARNGRRRRRRRR